MKVTGSPGLSTPGGSRVMSTKMSRSKALRVASHSMKPKPCFLSMCFMKPWNLLSRILSGIFEIFPSTRPPLPPPRAPPLATGDRWRLSLRGGVGERLRGGVKEGSRRRSVEGDQERLRRGGLPFFAAGGGGGVGERRTGGEADPGAQERERRPGSEHEEGERHLLGGLCDRDERCFARLALPSVLLRERLRPISQ
mmetsp:Transcript_120683/g.336755  ORF Transcript_120683/g.336755 Transcript_120683/m.336755 type:complete len:196 (+) Transcript_120683:186-773(+)